MDVPVPVMNGTDQDVPGNAPSKFSLNSDWEVELVLVLESLLLLPPPPQAGMASAAKARRNACLLYRTIPLILSHLLCEWIEPV
jgi:hypothetical protein